MGKKNPIKQIMSAAADVTHNPMREIARAVGAKGAVKFVDKVKGAEEKLGHDTIDLANDEKGKQQKKADAANAIDAEKQRTQAAAASSAAAAAETARIESERMSAGSASRTLLTGPAGLEDEEESISRRTLKGR